MSTISTSIGKGAIAEKIGGIGSTSAFTYLHLGGDGTAATTANTQLGSQFTGYGLLPAEATMSTDAANILQATHRFTAGASSTLRESGLFEDGREIIDNQDVTTVTGNGEYGYSLNNNQYICIDSNGHLWLAQILYSDSSIVIYKSEDRGKTWAQSTTFSSQGSSPRLAIFADQNDDIHVIVLTETSGINHAIYSGGSWGSMTTGAVAAAPGISEAGCMMDTSGNIDVFFCLAVGTIKHYKYTSGGSWAAQTDITVSSNITLTMLSFAPTIDSNNDLWLFFINRTAVSTSDVYYVKKTGASWGSEVRLSETANQSPNQVISLTDSHDNIMVVWLNSVTGKNEYIYYDGSSWGDVTEAFSFIAGSSEHKLVLDKTNTIYWVANDSVNIAELYYAIFDGSEWGDAVVTKTFDTGSDYYGYSQTAVYGELPHQKMERGYIQAYSYAYYGASWFEEPAIYAYAAFNNNGLVIVSRSSFNDIYVDTGDSVTITTKIAIN